MTMLRRSSSVAIAFAALVLAQTAQPALADSPIETAIAGWVAAIDASPTWTATYRDLTYDATSDTAVISRLSIATENGNFAIDVDRLRVVGYSESANGGFAATQIEADGTTLEAGIFKVAIGDAKLDDIGTPQWQEIVFSPDHPFTAMIKAYGQAIRGHLGHGHLDSVAIIQQVQGQTSRISYGNVDLDGFVNGKLKSMKAGPIKLESPAPPNGLVNMSVDSVEGTDFDLGAIVHVYDPDAYVGGVGDELWRTAVGHAAYRGMVMDVPGAKISIRDLTLDEMRVRQPRTSFAGLIDRMMFDPNSFQQNNMDPEVLRQVFGMMGAFGFGRFSVDGIDVQATGVDRLSIGNIHMNDFSSDGLGEFAIEGVDVAVENQASVKVGRFAFGGLTFPAADAVVAAIEAQKSGAKVDPAPLMPKLGFIEVSDVDVAGAAAPHIALGRFRSDFGDYVGLFPTSIATEMTGLDIPADIITDRSARAMLDKLHYDSIHADYGLKFSWHEDTSTAQIDDFHLAIKDMGTLTASLTLAGLTRQMIEHVETLGQGQAASDIAFKSGKMTFKDESITSRGLAIQAEKMHVAPDKFAQQFAGALPFMLSFLRNGEFQKQVAPVLQAFVVTPGTLTAVAAPPSPVPLVEIEKLAKTAPQKLPDLLNLTVTGQPAPDGSSKP